ncbi:hypothetical protein [Wenyingzhuangia sp. 2_MG-2023]|uniref:hypothetical protein n=1 Tax=Wenyingzhuangia sp. 2_MG-2023 TaxID=3062639 RepID=UPI0026E1E67A|nr:hypothetical protein [Wenyingzhuangia sp. 2_MG-2023]MDO6739403.1 hypothetical protein [Wenyingzhuangia sp. 2_MG-2023]
MSENLGDFLPAQSLAKTVVCNKKFMDNKVEKNRKIEESLIYKNLKNAKWILLIGIIITLVSPILLTFSSKFDITNFSNTGQIGDTIGGITSPVVNLLGAILVFYALKAQIEANKLIQDQFYEQKKEENQRKNLLYISKLYDFFIKNIENFTYDSEKSVGHFTKQQTEIIIYKGSLAIHYFLENLQWSYLDPHNDSEALNQKNIKPFLNILKLLDLLVDKLNNTNIPIEDKEFYKNLILQQTEYTLFTGVINDPETYSGPFEVCKKCGNKHSRIPFIIIRVIDDLKEKIKLLQPTKYCGKKQVKTY